jgi:ATP-dependent RNA helicase DDX35
VSCVCLPVRLYKKRIIHVNMSTWKERRLRILASSAKQSAASAAASPAPTAPSQSSSSSSSSSLSFTARFRAGTTLQPDTTTHSTPASSSSSSFSADDSKRPGPTGNSAKFWKPGAVAPGLDIERETESETRVVHYNPNVNRSLRQQKMLLPVYACRRRILYALEKYQTVVLVGETGSGKTTQVPQYLYEAGWVHPTAAVVCTQPRRIAASSVAARVAEEMNVSVGGEVGYCIRFDDRTDAHRTKIKYVTDGILLRETMYDPLLSKYSVVMIDEAHERSLNTDILLGLLRKIQKKRPELRVIVSSATIDAHAFKTFFETNKHSASDPHGDTACVIRVQGRQFPVDIYYLKFPIKDYVKACIDTVHFVHKTEQPGDVLVFLPGRQDIERVVATLDDMNLGLHVLPMYSGLRADKQLQVFKRAPRGRRKVVVSTNVAETSVTIPGIRYVIDSGFAKIPSYNARDAMSSLLAEPISQASANQRAGRAGRVMPGKCFRLYTEVAYVEELPKRTTPEIQRCNLASVVLQLKSLGIDDIASFAFLTPPPNDLLTDAEDMLHAAGALDQKMLLTPLGLTMSEFPVDPQLARLLFAAGTMGCGEEILSIGAMLSVQSVFIVPRQRREDADQAKQHFAVFEGDHLTLLNVFNAFVSNGKQARWCQEYYLNYKALLHAVKIRKQLHNHMIRFDIPIVSGSKTIASQTALIETLCKCVVTAYFANAAQLGSDGTYRTVRGSSQLEIHPTSVLFEEAPAWVVYHDVQETTKRYMREVTEIQPSWLHEIAPHYYRYRSATSHYASSDIAKARTMTPAEPQTSGEFRFAGLGSSPHTTATNAEPTVTVPAEPSPVQPGLRAPSEQQPRRKRHRRLF